jgi:hypothetical protein
VWKTYSVSAQISFALSFKIPIVISFKGSVTFPWFFCSKMERILTRKENAGGRIRRPPESQPYVGRERWISFFPAIPSP